MDRDAFDGRKSEIGEGGRTELHERGLSYSNASHLKTLFPDEIFSRAATNQDCATANRDRNATN